LSTNLEGPLPQPQTTAPLRLRGTEYVHSILDSPFGLSADMTAVDVVGNNLANLKHAGLQGQRGFLPRLGHGVAGAGLGETQVGFGTGRPFTTREFTQSAIQSSTGLLDGAIEGDGFFILPRRAGPDAVHPGGQLPGRQPRLSDHHDRRESRGLDGRRRGHRQTPPGLSGDIVVPVGT